MDNNKVQVISFHHIIQKFPIKNQLLVNLAHMSTQQPKPILSGVRPSQESPASQPCSKYEAVLPNNRSSNSANYIPAKIYESYREQNSSQLSKGSRRSNLGTEEISAYQKLSQLSERLKNIHHFYKLRIDEQRAKNAERNEVFMTIVEELQKGHNDKIVALQHQIQTAQDQKKQVSYVDDKMSEIKGSIDEILKQSATYKVSNQKLQKQIMLKQQSLRQKEKNLQKLKKQQIEFRNQLQDFQKSHLKQNRKQRQMLQMIDNIVGAR